MTFQSLEYLIFLPVVFILYWTVCRGSKTLQNELIVAASLVFYGWWDWRFFYTIASNYSMQSYIDNDDAKEKTYVEFQPVLE